MKSYEHHSINILDIVRNVESLNLVNFLYNSILCVGILGNFVNIIVLARRNMRRLIVFRMLLCLSIVDFIFLILCALQTLVGNLFYTDIRVTSLLFCKLDTFLAYFLLHIRNIFTIAINFHSKIFILFYWFKKSA